MSDREESRPEPYVAPSGRHREQSTKAPWSPPDQEELAALREEVDELAAQGLLGPNARHPSEPLEPTPDATEDALCRLRELLAKPNALLPGYYDEVLDAMRTVLQRLDGRGHRLDAAIRREQRIDEVRDMRRSGLGMLTGSTFAGWEDGHDGVNELSPIEASSGEVYDVQNN